MLEMELLSKLEEWYRERCDGVWEHHHGIDITTLDNPGWSVRIALHGTPFAFKPFAPVKEDRGADDWMQCFIENGVFVGAGDPSKLSAILEQFLRFVE